jgi:esterase/lipase
MKNNQRSPEEELRELEENEVFEDNNSDLPPNDIVAFNELRSCSDLVRMYKTEQLEIQPDFQRDIVWKKPAQTRFIDSLVKQLPIPSICISLDYKTNKRLVIDGLQRMQSIINFLDEEHENWRLSKLNDVDDKISGKTVATIKSKYPKIYDRVENLTIPVTVLRCDYSKPSHMKYLFTIFHRLNTGGLKLNNQEIRNCIFNGSFNKLLKIEVNYENFRALLGLEKDKTYRFIYEELILRFFAFFDWLDKYNGKLSAFLNDYMNEYKDADETFISEKKHLFERVINLLYIRILSSNKLPHISKATTEGIMIGIAKNINQLESLPDETLKSYYHKLREDDLYSIENLKEGLSQKEKVLNRLNRAINIFNGQD